MLNLIAAGRTKAGDRRGNNDSFHISKDNKVFAVIDGGGGPFGKASSLVLKAIEEAVTPPVVDHLEVEKWLSEVVGRANSNILQEHPDGWRDDFEYSFNAPSACIILAVQSEGGVLQIAYVGNCRAYLIRDGDSTLLTRDHTVLQEMLKADRLTQEQARTHAYENFIMRCLGNEDQVKVDLISAEIKPNDWMVLCSDGLWKVLTDDQLSCAIAFKHEPEDVCDELIKQALAVGAPDDVTVLAIKFDRNYGGTEEKQC